MDELIYSSAATLARSIRDIKVSALEVVEAHLRRIEEVNPRLNAVVQPAADRARAEARESDEALARGEVKGPLHGVPMTIKDSLDTVGIISTGGTQGRASYIPVFQKRTRPLWPDCAPQAPSCWARPTRRN